MYAVFVMTSYTHLRQKQETTRIPLPSNNAAAAAAAVRSNKPTRKKITPQDNHQNQCYFRNYPKRRYYGLHESPQPDFLQNAEYIYGQLPLLLKVDTSRLGPSQGKLCINQTDWFDNSSTTIQDLLPFADGTNPSILALSRVPSLQPAVADAKYLATLCLTNSQCSWKDSVQDKQEYHISERDTPATIRTVLLWLNENMQTLYERTVLLERDAPWGRKNPPIKDGNGKYVKEMKPLDDARLFVFNDTVWISYRDGPSFGYDKQVLNPLSISSDDAVTIKASESIPFCCGRNMALMEQPQVRSMQVSIYNECVFVLTQLSLLLVDKVIAKFDVGRPSHCR